MSGRLWIVAGGLLVVAVIALILILVPRDTPDEPISYGPWYPMENEHGDPVAADFENHVPCAIDEPPVAGCDRVKLGIVLYRDAVTDEPTTFLISIVRVAVSDDRETHSGTWRITEGTALDPEAIVYELDSSVPAQLRHFWAISDDILFLLDSELKPRVGDAAYGYALNSVPLGQRYLVPEN